MIKSMMLLLAMLGAITGCAERYYNGKGAELLVYPETHTYLFTLISSGESQRQLEMLFEQVSEIDPGASYEIEYRNSRARNIAQSAIDKFPTLELAAEAFSLTRNTSLSKDLKVVITYHALVTQKCRMPAIEGPETSINCFVESARARQVVHKESLVEGL